MAFPTEDSAVDARTIYAKPFPKSTTADYVRELFGKYGSIRRVKLRREAVSNSFRGSVYIEFVDATSAHAAVNSPPQQPRADSAAPGTYPRFHVMMKADYERKRANASSSGGGKDGGFGGGGGGSAHKRARHLSEGPATSSQGQQPPPPPPLPVEQHGMTPVSISKHSHQQIQQLRQIAEEREATVRSLEGALRKELEENQRLHQRLEEAQQRAQEAAAREAAASQKALTRDVEIGSLKGEIAMLRTQNAAHLERQSAAHKARIADLEASVQRLKDALLEKERGERELRRAACNKGDTSGAYRADGSGNLDDL